MPDEASVERLKISCHSCGAKIDVTGETPFRKVDCPSCGVKFHIPKRFDHFLLEEILGENEHCHVYRALDLTLSREVALKVFKESISSQKEKISTILEQAGKVALINHSNIVPIYSCGEGEGKSFIVMQYMGASSMMAYLDKAKGLLPPVSVYRCIREVAKGLDAALKNGIQHENIHPGNILVDSDGHIKVNDFGISKALMKVMEAGNRELGKYINPQYVSPEFLMGGEAGTSGNIYSLGATFYYLLTGVKPFLGKSDSEIINERVERDPIAPNIVRKEIPKNVSDYIMKMMSRSKTGRPDSFKDIEKKTDEFLKSGRAASSTNDAVKSKKEEKKPDKKPIKAVKEPTKPKVEDKKPATQPKITVTPDAPKPGKSLSWLPTAILILAFLTLLFVAGGLVVTQMAPESSAANSFRNLYNSTLGGFLGKIEKPVPGENNPDVAKTDDKGKSKTDDGPKPLPEPPAIKTAGRPHPTNLNFKKIAGSLSEYIYNQDGDAARALEKERIQRLARIKSSIVTQIKSTEYEGPVTLSDGQVINGTITTATMSTFTLKEGDQADRQIAWNDASTRLYLDILIYYAAAKMLDLNADESKESNRLMDEISYDFFNAALLSDWFGYPEAAVKFSAMSLKYNSALKADLHRFIPSRTAP